MIPVLDLMNHKRGIGATSDVSYTRMEEGSIRVIAKRDLEVNSIPSITYGAKGNSFLLLRYGFCLEQNIEPDNSSNDILEFGKKSVQLRTGPKSYTLGPFKSALNEFLVVDELERDSDENQDEGVEDFLNACEEDEEEDDFDMYQNMDEIEDDCAENDFDMYENMDSIQNKEDAGGDKNVVIQAIADFMEFLEGRKNGYRLSGKYLKEALDEKDGSKKFYSAIIVSSELRTIMFYLWASAMIKGRLENDDCDINKTYDFEVKSEDEKLLYDQAIELTDLYFKLQEIP